MLKIYEYRGVEGLVAAPIIEDSTDNYTTGDVIEIAGVSEISKETDSTQESHYYDNIPAVVISSTGADTLTINASAIPLDVLAKITGQVYDSAKGLFVEQERTPGYWAIGYRTKDTNGVERFVWKTKCFFNVPGEDNKTIDDSTDANGQELTVTSISTIHKFTSTGKSAKGIVLDTSVNPMDAATFFGSVQTPDTINDVPIAVTGVTVAPKTVTISLSGASTTEQLTATLSPSGATGTITWTSSDDTVATVSNAGLVSALTVGTATITATCEGKTDTCAVEVTA